MGEGKQFTAKKIIFLQYLLLTTLYFIHVRHHLREFLSISASFITVFDGRYFDDANRINKNAYYHFIFVLKKWILFIFKISDDTEKLSANGNDFS
jgi:hypothetical protein